MSEPWDQMLAGTEAVVQLGLDAEAEVRNIKEETALEAVARWLDMREVVRAHLGMALGWSQMPLTLKQRVVLTTWRLALLRVEVELGDCLETFAVNATAVTGENLGAIASAVLELAALRETIREHGAAAPPPPRSYLN